MLFELILEKFDIVFIGFIVFPLLFKILNVESFSIDDIFIFDDVFILFDILFSLFRFSLLFFFGFVLLFDLLSFDFLFLKFDSIVNSYGNNF